MVRQYAACLYNQNLFICIVRRSVSMDREKWLRKTEEKRAAKWEIIGNDFVWVGRPSALLRILHNTSFNFFGTTAVKTDDKTKRNPIYIHGILNFFYVTSLLFLLLLRMLLLVFLLLVFVSFANFVWPLRGFGHLSGDGKKNISHLLSIKWFGSDISQRMKDFCSKGKYENSGIEIHTTRLFGYTTYQIQNRTHKNMWPMKDIQNIK